MTPHKLTGSDIRHLRQRLGWSMAEMARQMGCTTDLIGRWEAGQIAPESEAVNQLKYLQGYVEQNSERVRQSPEAEDRMETRGLSQLTHRDLLNDL